MQRTASGDLHDWLTGQDRRKPLVLRGARQVGKTWLVRDLAARAGRELVELNFERDPAWMEAFVDNDPAAILRRIGLRLGRRIDPARHLLFLDEIQEFGELLAKLRWFAEESPALPLIAAGSLLEFTLRDHGFSMPVGRVSFSNLEPLTFAEYLAAHGQDLLLEVLQAWRPGDPFEPTAHRQLLHWQDRYALAGGMPGIVASELGDAQPGRLRALQRELLATYRADFPKYAGRVDAMLLHAVLASVAGQLGGKFVYQRADPDRPYRVKPALELLCLARLCTVVRYSTGTGIPLAAGTKETFRKIGLLDVGLLHALLETPAAVAELAELVPAARAAVAEQLVIQALRARGPRDGDPAGLFYWQREGGRPGEIDHLIQHRGRVVPIELKSGSAGAMKSLHQFVHDQGLDLAVRIDRNPPSVQDLDLRTTRGDRVRYRLLSLPIALLGQLDALLDACDPG